MSLPTHLPGCGEPAIVVFEIFTRTGMAYSLDGRLNVCGAHVIPALQTLRAAGFEPHQATGTAGVPGRCGDGYDYVARTALTAPAREGTTMTRTVTTEGSLIMSHLTDLAAQVTTDDDVWSLSGHLNRQAGERAMLAADSLSRAAAKVAARLKDELDAADIRAVYAADPHRSKA
jgi:hypothetical protein